MMRLDHDISFWLEDEAYNPVTHQYGEPELVAEISASVTDVGTDRSVALFGKYEQAAKVIRTVEPIASNWSYLTIDDGDTHYSPRTVRVPLQNATLIVGETE